MRRMMVMLVAVLAFMALGTATVIADDGPGAGSPACAKDDPGCQPDDGGKPPAGEECPPADGPISGAVQQLSDGIRGAGGGPLADLIDQINCGLVVGVLHLGAPGPAR